MHFAFMYRFTDIPHDWTPTVNLYKSEIAAKKAASRFVEHMKKDNAPTETKIGKIENNKFVDIEPGR